jgi:hypothetical protein
LTSLSKKARRLLVVSLLVTLVVITEIFGILINLAKPEPVYNWVNRYMLFQNNSQGPVFENKNNYFVYEKNSKVRSVTFYSVDGKWQKEYDYRFSTNNLGLVQASDIDETKSHTLLLGDSFLEGQGSSPWFDGLADLRKPDDHHLINGGILGTGFQSWKLLHDDLRKFLDIKKVYVLFLSDDFQRDPWTMKQATLTCISEHKYCEGDEDFFGLPGDSSVENYLDKFQQFRNRPPINTIDRTKEVVRKLFPSSTALYLDLKSFLWNKTESEAQTRNAKVIEDLINEYMNHITFIHIPSKDEAILGRRSELGKRADQVILQNGGRLLDFAQVCPLQARHFLPIDGHPNSQGYNRIKQCFVRVLNGSL